MPDYSQAKLYKICSPSTEDIYIGSTCRKLTQRLSRHRTSHRLYKKGRCRYITSSEIIKYPDHYIELIRDVSCTNKKELNKIESQAIRSTECVNKVVPNRKKKEYRKTFREKILEQHRLYERNRKVVRNCVCGKSYNCAKKSVRDSHYVSRKHQKYLSDFYNRLSEHLTQ